MEREVRPSKNKIIKSAAMGTAAGLAFFGQGLSGSPIKTASQDQILPTQVKPSGVERQYVQASLSSESQRNLLEQIDRAYGKPNMSLSAENVQESLKPGDIAPETWGGAGIFDVMSVYVQDPEFNGQAVFLHKHGSDGFTYTLLAGRTPNGEIVKGANFKSGLDSISSNDELNLALGGNGGAQLRFDKDTKGLTFWMNGFPIASSENPKGRRISFVSQVEADQGENGKSRVLHQPFPSESLRYYMRAGSKSSPEGKGTTFLLVAHASLRQIPSTTPPLPEGIPLVPPLSVVSFPDESLYVVQSDNQVAGGSTSFVWKCKGGTPDLKAETSQKIGFNKWHPSGKVFPVPAELTVLVNDREKIEIDIYYGLADLFAFSTVVPNPITGKDLQILISLPELQTHKKDQDGLLYTQTIGVPATAEQSNK